MFSFQFCISIDVVINDVFVLKINHVFVLKINDVFVLKINNYCVLKIIEDCFYFLFPCIKSFLNLVYSVC